MKTLQDYLNLIPPPNRIQPKYMAWLSACLKPVVDTQNFIHEIIRAFDVETAQGKQLDIIGEILNCSRILNFQPTASFNAIDAIPIVVNYDTPNTDLIIYQESGKSVFLVGIELVNDIAFDFTIKSGTTTLVTYEFNDASGLVQTLCPNNPSVICNTNPSDALVFNSSTSLPPFQVYVVAA